MNQTRERHGAMALLRSSVRGRRRQLTGLAAWSVVQALPAYLSGYVVARAIDDGFLAGRSGLGLMWLGLLGASLLLGAWGTRETYERLAAVVEPFRDQLVVGAVDGALRRSPDVTASAGTAAVARVTQHVEIVREAYASVLMVTQSFLITVISALLGLFTLAPVTLVLVVPPLLVGLVVFVLALRPMAARQRASILADERIAETATTMVGGLRDVVASGAEEEVEATVAEQIDAQARATRAVATVTAFRSITVVLGGWVPVVLILVAGPWLLDRGATAGAIIGALFYVLQGVQPALQSLVEELGGSGLWLLVTLDRLAETAPSPDSAALAQSRVGGDWGRPEGHEVRLSTVTFRYGPGAEPVIDRLDLVIPEGHHLAVVGPSGAGKSTLAGLISGLLAAEAGEVSIGGVPVGHLDTATLAGLRVLIPQEAYVFTGTLGENLTYLNPDATRGHMEHAVDRLGASELVERLGGYDAQLRPSSLSAGERQLVTVVRAYLSPAPIVVLDEATCHLDPAAEAMVEGAFVARPDTTLIVIAHRITSALRASRSLVLDGAAATLGTHEDLLDESPLYRDLMGHWV